MYKREIISDHNSQGSFLPWRVSDPFTRSQVQLCGSRHRSPTHPPPHSSPNFKTPPTWNKSTMGFRPGHAVILEHRRGRYGMSLSPSRRRDTVRMPDMYK